jgi:hypothetical protein
MDLLTIILAYNTDHQENASKEQTFFKIQRSIEEVIRLAAFAVMPGGKRFSHQRRIPPHVLQLSYTKLQQQTRRIKKTRNFEELYTIITEQLSPIKGAGLLYIYDTAFRIGAFLNLEPEFVYLHAGTRTGAKKLGLDCSGKYLTRQQLPPALRTIKPFEVEDILCIYKDNFDKDSNLPPRRPILCGLQ